MRLIKDQIGDIPGQYTADAIVKDLAALEIDSENKLAKRSRARATSQSSTLG